jgi:hypothetical protein
LILSGHQPVYLPGIIVMNKIALSDRFMFVGHCDYQPRSWHTRNYIRGAGTPLLLSVPVNKGKTINETVPLPDMYWRSKHLRSIELAYHGRPFFDDYFPELEKLLQHPHASLTDLNKSLIFWLMECLGIDTPVFMSEDFNITGHKTAMLVNMCRAMGADHYLSSPGELYVDKTLMNGYAHSFQEFVHPVYDQGGEFIPNLSVIDLLFNCGPASGAIVRDSGSLA